MTRAVLDGEGPRAHQVGHTDDGRTNTERALSADLDDILVKTAWNGNQTAVAVWPMTCWFHLHTH